jgi:glycosyltransferase involved in cell wall biosynthesis
MVPPHQTRDVNIPPSRRICAEVESLHDAYLEAVLLKPNAIDPSRSTPEHLKLPRDVCVSRIDPTEGLEYVMDAVELLRRPGPEVQAHVVGAPSSRSHESLG